MARATIDALQSAKTAESLALCTRPAFHLPGAAFLATVTLLAFLLLGYHPYAEDGGIYAAALAAKLDPNLFAHDRAWVTGHTRFSLFVPATAALLQILHVSLPMGLLALQFVSLAATVWALLRLARLCCSSERIAQGATLLVAIAAGLPVAGTSLYLLDPYVTARSVTTPVLLLALAAALQSHWRSAALLWLAAFVFHPLMAAWAVLPLLLLVLLPDPMPSGISPSCLFYLRRPLLFCAAISAGGLLTSVLTPPADALTRTLAETRAYWFLSQWHWYELAGVWLPLSLLAIALGCLAVQRQAGLSGERVLPAGAVAITTGQRASTNETIVGTCSFSAAWTALGEPLAYAVFLAGATAILLAVFCARAGARRLVLARLQPLRTLHVFYAVFLLLFAGLLLEWVRQHRQRRTALTTVAAVSAPLPTDTRDRTGAKPNRGSLTATSTLAGAAALAAVGLICMQHSLYAASGWLELPGLSPSSPWEQAFVWVRQHTPTDAVFALDGSYITIPGEDAQGFRAIALRSALPDRAKDGGIAAVVPTLAISWQVGTSATAGLDTLTDADRLARLRPLGVDWIVLPPASVTSLPCPYRNTAAKVCRLR